MNWNFFNSVGKDLPETKEVINIPKQFRETVENTKLNRITIRYFDKDFLNSNDINGEIVNIAGVSLILFNVPFKGAILITEGVIYNNWSKEGEKTIDITENYPYGIDKKSSLLRFSDIKYYNIFKDVDYLNNSQQAYYKKEYKFYIPVMLNKIPLPIIELANAERYTIIDKDHIKTLANISQDWIRNFLGIKVMERSNNKKNSGAVYIAIVGILSGMVIDSLLRAFIG